MRIEIFYFQGCPNHHHAVERVREVLKQEGLQAELAAVEVPDAATAQKAGFLGSPTVRVNGVDVEPAARSSKQFGMMCRTYVADGKREGAPPAEMIREAVRQAARAESGGGSKPRLGLLAVSVVAAIAASLCCILPIVAALTGLSLLSAAVWAEKSRPLLLGATGVLLGAGLWLAYRDYRKACAPGSLCATGKPQCWSVIALAVLAAAVIALAAFPYYSGRVAQAVAPQPAAQQAAPGTPTATAVFSIPNMDCPACATTLSANLRRAPGVLDARIEFEGRKATVTYDASRQNVAALEKIVTDSGFQVAHQPTA